MELADKQRQLNELNSLVNTLEQQNKVQKKS
jgi:hypothetical protein